MPAAPHPILSLFAACCAGLLFGCEPKNTVPAATPPSPQPSVPAPYATLYKDSTYELTGPAQHYATVVRMGQPAPPPRPGAAILFQNEALYVLGDTALRGEFELTQRFTYRHAFADFPATPGRGPHLRPDFTTNPQARLYITRITEGAKEPANFAGHYRLVTWGCGSSCQMSALVDQHTGRIYDVPETALGLEYRLNSRLLITDHLTDEGYSNTFVINSMYPAPAFYLWTGKQFRKLE